MAAQLIDGKSFAQLLKDNLKRQIEDLTAKGERPPGLAVIMVGKDPASQIYVGHKTRACKQVGIHSHLEQLPDDTDQDTLLGIIDRLNQDPTIDGILVQLPLPAQINPAKVIETISPAKDVDGFHPYNLGRLAQRNPALRPCTPHGICHLLKDIGADIKGSATTIVGASNIVGRPMALELLMEGGTVSICHRFTPRELLQTHVQNADILIVAIGKPGIINSDWLKPGVIVVDVGMNRLRDGRLVGDIDFDSAKEIAGWITPVPGGVGPMTVATLLENTFKARVSE
jgi:methylenetetrahydrofolate dehydrogenase (NADP+) / methenyltetrahydrofolate cyclohydrolase